MELLRTFKKRIFDGFGRFSIKHKEIWKSCTRFFGSGLSLKLGIVHESKRRNAYSQRDSAFSLSLI